MILVRTIFLVLVVVGYVSSSSLSAMLHSNFEDNSLDNSLTKVLASYGNKDTADFSSLLPDKDTFDQWLTSIKEDEAFEFLNDVTGLTLITFALSNGLDLMQPEAFSQDVEDLSATRDLIWQLVDFITSNSGL